MITSHHTVVVSVALILATLSGGAKAQAHSRPYPEPNQQKLTRVSLVALLSPDCGCNTMPAFPVALEAIRAEMRRRAIAAGARYAAVGIVLSDDVQSGIDYLVNGRTATGLRVDLGQWDEVHAGDNWRNEAMLSLVWGEGLVDAAFPQIVLIEREMELSDGAIRVISTRRSLRLLGTAAFERWVAEGMALPDSSVLASR